MLYFFKRVTDQQISVLIFTLSFLIYLSSMPTTITLEDDGFFIMAAFHHGIAHPPGYPVYTAIANLFALIPFGGVASRVHIVSVLFASLTIVLIYNICLYLTKERYLSITSALILAFSPRFWSQSIIAEVYTLNTFLYLSILMLVLIIRTNIENLDILKKYIPVVVFLYGFSLANHWPLIILSSLAFLILLWSSIWRYKPIYLKSLPLFFLGLMPYVWMMIRSNMDISISYTGPITSPTELLAYIMRDRYTIVDNSVQFNVLEKLKYIWFYLKEFSGQFYHVGSLFILLGVYSLFLKNRVITSALLLALLGNSLILILLLNFEYSALYQHAIAVFFILGYCVASIFLCFGLMHVQKTIKDNYKVYMQLAFGLYVVVTLALSYQVNDRSNYSWGERYAREVLSYPVENASLFVHDDITAGTIGYTHHILNVREDINLLSDKGLVFSNRIINPDQLQSYKKTIKTYLGNNTTVYTTDVSSPLFTHNFWLVRQSDPENKQGDYLHLEGLKKDYLSYVYKCDDCNDYWTRMHRHNLLNASIPFVVQLLGRGVKDQLLDSVVSYARNHLDSIIILLQVLGANSTQTSAYVLQLQAEAGELFHVSLSKRNRANYYNYHALEKLKQSDNEGAKNYLNKSMSEWSSKENKAFFINKKINEENN